MDGMLGAAKTHNIPLTINYVCGIFGLFFSEEEKITNFSQAAACNQDYFSKFFHSMLEQGVYLAPSSYEAGFISNAHSEETIQKTIEIATNAFRSI